MNNQTSQSLDAIDLLLLAGVVTLEAITVLAVALAALLLTASNWRPKSAPASVGRCVPPPPPPAPAVHPLSLLAAELEVLPVSRLRPIAGVRSKRLRKNELVAVLAAC